MRRSSRRCCLRRGAAWRHSTAWSVTRGGSLRGAAGDARCWQRRPHLSQLQHPRRHRRHRQQHRRAQPTSPRRERSLDDRRQLAVRDHLHDDVQVPALHEAVAVLHHVGVVQAGQQAHLVHRHPPAGRGRADRAGGRGAAFFSGRAVASGRASARAGAGQQRRGSANPSILAHASVEAAGRPPLIGGWRPPPPAAGPQLASCSGLMPLPASPPPTPQRLTSPSPTAPPARCA